MDGHIFLEYCSIEYYKMTYEPVLKLILFMRFEHFARFLLAISFWPEISTPSDFFVTRSYLSKKEWEL